MPYIRLYLDHLVEIEEILARVRPDAVFRSYSVEGAGVSCESVEELETLAPGQRLTEVQITLSAEGAYLSLTVDDWQAARIYLGNEHDLEARGAFDAIAAVMQGAALGSVRRFLYRVGLSGGLVLTYLSAVTILLTSALDASIPGWAVGVGLVAMAWAAVGGFLGTRIRPHAGRVVLARRSDAPGFFARNKDLIVVGTITTVCGSILGGLAVALLT